MSVFDEIAARLEAAEKVCVAVSWFLSQPTPKNREALVEAGRAWECVRYPELSDGVPV